MRSPGRIVAAFCMTISLLVTWASPALAVAGDVDPTFSGDGYAITQITSARTDGAEAIALSSDNKVVVAGYTSSSSYNFAVARYNLDGSLDTTFSGDGKWAFDFPVRSGASPTNDHAYDVAIQADGKIVVVGGAGSRVGVVRLTAAGALDSTFTGDGWNTFLFDTGASGGEAQGVAIQPDGNIVIAGWSSNGSTNHFGVARVRASDGALDPTFSGDGRLTSDFGDGGDLATAMAVQSDGKIILIGQTSPTNDNDVAIARYTTQGTLDTTFSGDGKQTTEIGGINGSELMTSVALQSDGKIVAAGYRSTSNGNQFALVRYTTSGGLDTSFSGDGKQFTSFAGYSPAGRAVAIQPNGKIVVGGEALSSTPASFDIALARYNVGGGLDSTFSGDGRLLDPINSNSLEGLNDVAIAADGKIVGAGWTDVTGTSDFLVARYLAA